MGDTLEALSGLRGWGGQGSLTPEAHRYGVMTSKNSNRLGPDARWGLCGLWRQWVTCSNGWCVRVLDNSAEGRQWSGRNRCSPASGTWTLEVVASVKGETTGIGRGRVGGRSGECPQEEEGAGGAPRLPAQGSCDSTPPLVQCGQPRCSWES